MDRNTVYEVKNRSASMVIYRIPEFNIRREFAPSEVKKISFDELEKLSFRPGGRELMANFLQIRNLEATKELGIKTEIEYNMSEQDVVKLLQEGELDAFLDALDFAPVGVLDLIKDYSVKLPLMDLKKRKALLDKLGFDVTKALEHIEAEKAEDEAPESAPKTRRVKQTAEEETKPTRRTQPKYSIVEEEGKTE